MSFVSPEEDISHKTSVGSGHDPVDLGMGAGEGLDKSRGQRGRRQGPVKVQNGWYVPVVHPTNRDPDLLFHGRLY